MKCVLFVPVFLVLMFALSVSCFASDVPSDEIKNAATDGFIKYYKRTQIYKQVLKKQAEHDNAVLGDGFRIFGINTRKLTEDSTPQDLQTLLVPQNQWKFPVVSGGKTITYIRTSYLGEKWSAAGSDPSPLPKEMDGIMATWPVSSGYSYRYITGASAVFVELSREGKVAGYIPLSVLMAKTDRTRGEFKPGDLLDPQEMLNELRLQIKKNNEWYNTPPDEVMNAAREAFRFQLKLPLIPPQLRALGFKSETDKDNAELGEGYRVYILDAGKLLNESAPQDFNSLVYPGGWIFPIVVNGEMRSAMNLHFSDWIWRFGGIGGGAGQSRLLSALKTTWPPSSGYQYRYISTALFGKWSCIELSQGGKIAGVIPLKNLFKQPGRKAGVFKSSDLRDPQEALNELRSQIKKFREMNKDHMDNDVWGAFELKPSGK